MITTLTISELADLSLFMQSVDVCRLTSHMLNLKLVETDSKV